MQDEMARNAVAMKRSGGRHRGVSTGKVKCNTCKDCGKTKPASEFYNDPCLKKGIKNVCVKCYADRKRQERYGLAPGQYDEMLAAQNYRCACCKEHQDNVGVLGVDHCHATGKDRALLCLNCNTALGHTYEDPWRLMQLIKYVRKHNYPAAFGASTQQ